METIYSFFLCAFIIADIIALAAAAVALFMIIKDMLE